MGKPETCRGCIDMQLVPGGNYQSLFCTKCTKRRFIDRVVWHHPDKPIPTPEWCPRGSTEGVKMERVRV